MEIERFSTEYMEDLPEPPIPDSLAGLFTLVSCLKHSESSRVYLLRGNADGQMFVLRVAPVDAYERMMREHCLLRQLHDDAFPHPVVCFEEGQNACLIREYIPGTPLSDIVENTALMKPALAVDYARQVCAMLSTLHAFNPPVIHRDIKPHNLIRSPDGKLHLVDLDAVQAYRPERGMDTVVMGTAVTAAPEQFGYRRCDTRTDIYGIGMLLVFLLTGDYEVKRLRKTRIGSTLFRIIHKCLEFDPRRRYGSVKQLDRQLSQWQTRWKRRLASIAAMVLLTTLAYGVHIHWDRLGRKAAVFSIQASRQVYTFHSPAVEKAVRLQLNRPEGDITREDLKMIGELYLCGQEVYSRWEHMWSSGTEVHLFDTDYMGVGTLENLTDFQNMPNLRMLGLSRLGLTDLSPLVDLPLSMLAVCGNHITDLAALSQMTQLITLDLSDNPVTSLEGIEKCSMLENLTISSLPVTDLRPLAAMNLHALVMYEMPSNLDASALDAMDSVHVLRIRELHAQAIENVAKMKHLQHLSAAYCVLSDLSIAEEMHGLISLEMPGNQLRSLDGIQEMRQLTRLNIDDNKVSDMGSLEGMPYLRELYIRNNPIEDFSVIESLPALERLTLSRDQERLLRKPIDEHPFAIFIQ